MVYIRSKKVKGDNYFYLVKSVWDSKKASAVQQTIKYLGKADKVTEADIPKEYRNEQKIVAFLSKHSKEGAKKYDKVIQKTQKQLLELFKNGDLNSSMKIFREYRETYGTTDFYEKILKPVMYNVGELWAKKKIDISTEHVCSNIASSLVKTIRQQNPVKCTKQKILLCTPVGEEHHLGCDVLESFLACKGFKIFNLAPSAPSESVLRFIVEKKPDTVIVSITLEDNIKSGQRLIKKIHEKFDGLILIGGQAVNNNGHKFDAKIVTDVSLEKIPKIVRN